MFRADSWPLLTLSRPDSEAMFPGLLDFKAQVDSIGRNSLTQDEQDMRMQEL